MAAILDWLLAVGIVVGIFFMFYTAYRQQSMLDTVREIKEMFEDKTEAAKEAFIYK